MAEATDGIRIDVLVAPDGGTQVSVPPVDGERLAPLLESAATALRRAADSARRDLEPVTCPHCGAVSTGVTTSIDGTATLRPCGHVTGQPALA
jgi:hypothetical protein